VRTLILFVSLALLLAVQPASAPPVSAQLCDGLCYEPYFVPLRVSIRSNAPAPLRAPLLDRAQRAQRNARTDPCFSAGLLMTLDERVRGLGQSGQVSDEGVAAIHADITSITRILRADAQC
jgi:hypothetical protein